MFKKILNSRTVRFLSYQTNDSNWLKLKKTPIDPIWGTLRLYERDLNPNKVNLAIGVYVNEIGQRVLFNSTKLAEEKIVNKSEPKDYLPLLGNKNFSKPTASLIFGNGSDIYKNNLYTTIHTLGGTGALSIGTLFLKNFYKKSSTVWIPNPSYVNHEPLLNFNGLNTKFYKYYDEKTKNYDHKSAINDFRNIPKGSIVLLQACGHNPTGSNPNEQEWDELIDIIKKQNLFPFIDLSYQGLCSNSLENDAYCIKSLGEKKVEMMIAHSYSKIMGLYGERVGTLTVTSNNVESIERIEGEIEIIVRNIYSNPPRHGSSIASIILNDKEIRKLWLNEIEIMNKRIKKVRSMLVESLKKEKSSIDWNFLLKHQGMFSFTGLNEFQIKRLQDEYSIYITKDSRICVAGISSQNIPYVAYALNQVTK